MFARILATATILAASTTLVLAQQSAPDGKPGHRDMAPPPHHHGMRHNGHHRGPPPPPMKGFDLRAGHGNRLRVNCGDEPIQACIDAAAPLIEIISGDDGMTDESDDLNFMEPEDDTMPPPAPRADNGAAPTPPPPPQAAGDDAVPPPPPAPKEKVE